MPLRSDAYFRQLAEDALSSISATEPPVSMTDLADRYGIPVRLHAMPMFFRGATIYAVGRKETQRYKKQGIDLSRLDGVQVVCSSTGTVQTVYRNRNFRELRPRYRRNHRYVQG